MNRPIIGRDFVTQNGLGELQGKNKNVKGVHFQMDITRSVIFFFCISSPKFGTSHNESVSSLLKCCISMTTLSAADKQKIIARSPQQASERASETKNVDSQMEHLAKCLKWPPHT